MPRTGRPPSIAAEQYPLLVKLAQTKIKSRERKRKDDNGAEDDELF